MQALALIIVRDPDTNKLSIQSYHVINYGTWESVELIAELIRQEHIKGIKDVWYKIINENELEYQLNDGILYVLWNTLVVKKFAFKNKDLCLNTNKDLCLNTNKNSDKVIPFPKKV